MTVSVVVQTLLPDPVTTPINRPLGIPPGYKVSAFITSFVAPLRPTCSPFSHVHTPTFALFPSVQDQVTIGYLIPKFGAHRGISSKTTPIMPPRRHSQCLHPDEGLPWLYPNKGLPQTSVKI
jgi:hypothetical protein